MTEDSVVTIALLYPELLGTYGDQGNALVLRQRLEWRGIGARVLRVPIGQTAPAHADVYVLGGGEDVAQAEALRQLSRSPAFVNAVTGGAPVLAVCAGLQLLGGDIELADGTVCPGLGLLDASTRRLPTRAVGDVIATVRPDLALPPLVGFENHRGRTTLGPAAQPLATAIRGTGNGTDDRAEGAVQGAIVATYLHGPVLAANPGLADLLLARVVGRPLALLDMPHVEALRAERVAANSPSRERRRLRLRSRLA